MERRNFLKAAGASGIVILDSCASKTPEPGWQPSAHEAGDIRLRVLQYAVLAPNSHNAQPWLVELAPDGTMNLYVDRTRLLPASDPPARQIHISHGSFLELLRISASQFGYRAEIKLFPEGQYANNVVEPRPVAAIAIQPDPSAARDPLFALILERHTNKRLFDIKRSLSPRQLAELQTAPGTAHAQWRIVDSDPQRSAVADICRQAMVIEIASPLRDLETAGWFRFSDRELQAKRDGFGVAQNGAEGIKKWIAETFVLSRPKAADPNGAFAESAVTQTAEQASSAPAFAALVTKTNTRLDQVLTGRAYARVQLTATSLGLKMQPFSQVLQEYPEMAELQLRMKQTLNVPPDQTVQMLFRLGHAKPNPHTPRRDVSSLIAPNRKI